MAADGVFTPGPLDRDATFYVAGHRGLVGSAIWRKLESAGFTDLVGGRSSELDLKDRDAVFAFFAESKPKYVVLAAAKVGGILANTTYPVDFLSDNMRSRSTCWTRPWNTVSSALVFLGSSCIYPKFAEQPIREDSLLTGHLEQTNDAYAIAKIAGILQMQAVRRQYGLPVDLGHADEPLRAERQLLAAGLARSAGADPAIRRGSCDRVRRAVDELGHGHAPSRVPPRRRHGRRRAASDGALRRAGAGQRRHRIRRDDPRDRGDDRQRRRVHGRDGVGHHQA